ncbi:MAG: MFS transporter [Alphaproteobacteria bacterium]|nr:MFS transporter [Alphaproteobacteria bacterium]
MTETNRQEQASLRFARGSPAYWRASAALFLAAFSVFAAVYAVQPLLPIFAAEFAIDAAASSVALSVTTGTLAISLVLMGWLGNRFDRKALMLTTMVLTAVLTLAVPLSPDWATLVGARALMGIAVCGVPAIAMVYLAEEMSNDALGLGMGLFVGGSALGGMSGRLMIGYLAGAVGWRGALTALGALIVLNALLFWLLLPAPRTPRGRTLSLRELGDNFRTLFADKALPLLFACSFLMMGGFVAIYNYVGFRLLAPPYGLAQSQIALVFIVYLVGTLGSAWMGGLASRLGRRKVFLPLIVIMLIGLGTTLATPLWLIVLGMAIMTFAFFGAHAVASAWVARRSQQARAQGSAIYLLAYYAGSSVIGTIGGYGWSHWGWPGVVAFTAASFGIALLLAIRLASLPPLQLSAD